MLRLEIEKLHAGHLDFENISESGSMANESFDMGEGIHGLSQVPGNDVDRCQSTRSKQCFADGNESARNGLKAHENQDFQTDEVSMPLSSSEVSCNCITLLMPLLL